jgi:23S rRNA (guanine745-N1)-methyltransferase
MIDAALPYLRCPVCAEALSAHPERTLRCPRGHAFDLARQGYASLTAGRTPHSGDTAAMIEAREAFLRAGHYTFIANALTTRAVGGASATGTDGLVVDAGVGTGYYLARVLDGLPGAVGLGLDVSKPALRRAARAHPRAAAALADLWSPLPIADGAAGVLLNVFAPRNAAEYHRILHRDGVLLVVTPAPAHLWELIAAQGLLQVDPDKADRLAATLGDYFEPIRTESHERRLELTAAQARTLIAMTPSARHDIELPDHDVEVTAAIDLTVYRRAQRQLRGWTAGGRWWSTDPAGSEATGLGGSDGAQPGTDLRQKPVKSSKEKGRLLPIQGVGRDTGR